jgi:hypothetical protein
MNYFEKLCKWSCSNKKVFPKLPDALKRLEAFVGAEREKELLSKTMLFYISSYMLTQPRRRSTRKRKRVVIKRSSKKSKVFDEDSDSEFDPSDDDVPELSKAEKMRVMRSLIRQVM